MPPRSTISNHFYLIAMAQTDTIDQIAERVDHLLLRHEELQRTNALLLQQVQTLTLERDQLKSRLAAARARVDALIERLPTSAPVSPEASS
jgi:cell division protein ZapB